MYKLKLHNLKGALKRVAIWETENSLPVLINNVFRSKCIFVVFIVGESQISIKKVIFGYSRSSVIVG